MSLFAGIDMSAHTTSLALVDDEINTVANKRILRLYHPGMSNFEKSLPVNTWK